MNTRLRRCLLHLSIFIIVPLAAGLGARAFAQSTGAASGPTGQGPSATLEVVAPAAPQLPGIPFQFTTTLSELRFGDTVREWSTYDLELEYDASVLAIDAVAPGLCQPGSAWAMAALSPSVSTGCVGQLSTAPGVLETYTARCLAPGASPLHIGSRTTLASELVLPFTLTLVDTAVTCAAGPPPPPDPALGATPVPTFDPAHWRPAAATLLVAGPVRAQRIGLPFEFTTVIAALELTDSSPAWAGYDFELAYDASVIEIVSVAPNLCRPMGTWGNPGTVPHIITGCYAQESKSTGALETFSARCLKDGSSTLRIVLPEEPGAEFAGTGLFDEYARPLEMTFLDGSVTCGDDAAAPDSG